MKKGVIIYQGKYGSTDQYAHWLADGLGLPLCNAQSASTIKLEDYELIILGSSVYVGRLVIGKWLHQNENALAGKKLFMFIVCGTSAEDKDEQYKIIDDNLSSVVDKSTEVFFLPGRCIVNKLSWKDRIVLKMGAFMQKDPQKKAVMNSGFDHMDKNSLTPLIEAVKLWVGEHNLVM